MEKHETDEERKRREWDEAPPYFQPPEEHYDEYAGKITPPTIWQRFVSMFWGAKPSAADDLDLPFECTHEELLIDMRQPAEDHCATRVST
jgi:predicted transcriptional regulator